MCGRTPFNNYLFVFRRSIGRDDERVAARLQLVDDAR